MTARADAMFGDPPYDTVLGFINACDDLETARIARQRAEQEFDEMSKSSATNTQIWSSWKAFEASMRSYQESLDELLRRTTELREALK